MNEIVHGTSSKIRMLPVTGRQKSHARQSGRGKVANIRMRKIGIMVGMEASSGSLARQSGRKEGSGAIRDETCKLADG